MLSVERRRWWKAGTGEDAGSAEHGKTSGVWNARS